MMVLIIAIVNTGEKITSPAALVMQYKQCTGCIYCHDVQKLLIKIMQEFLYYFYFSNFKTCANMLY